VTREDYYDRRHAERAKQRARQTVERQGYRVAIQPAAWTRRRSHALLSDHRVNSNIISRSGSRPNTWSLVMPTT